MKYTEFGAKTKALAADDARVHQITNVANRKGIAPIEGASDRRSDFVSQLLLTGVAVLTLERLYNEA